MKIEIIEAGVDPNHQTDHCDWCSKKLYKDEDGYLIDGIQTCTHTEYVTLCYECRRKAGNRVR